MTDPHVFTTPVSDGLWTGWCSTHGSLLNAWTDERFAALDALGHATTFHGLDTAQPGV